VPALHCYQPDHQSPCPPTAPAPRCIAPLTLLLMLVLVVVLAVVLMLVLVLVLPRLELH
jgi:hypothetical protein